MTGTIPIVDLAPLRDGGAGLKVVAEAVGAACRGAGFFYLRNAAVPPELRAQVFGAAHRLFGSPPAVKDAVAIARSRHNRGYVGLAVEALDPKRGPDRKEAFNIGLDLPGNHPDVLAHKPFRGVNLWPDLPDFRATLIAYYDAMWRVGVDLHRAIAVDLGLPEQFFADKLDAPMATLRLLHYPAAEPAAAGQLGAGEHTDYGNLTLLATDEVGGLEIMNRDGSWLPAPVIPDAFICNIGDCLMRWTNDTYVSTPHRVVNPTGQERYSVAFFLDPNPDAVVACLPTCTGATRPQKYPTVRASDYLRGRLDATYTTGGIS